MSRNFDYPMPQEGRMARQQLARISMDAAKLHNALRDDDDLPAWVLLKINTAEDRLHMAADYMRYKVAPGLDAYQGAEMLTHSARGYGVDEDDTAREERRKFTNQMVFTGIVFAAIGIFEMREWLKRRKAQE
jgi:hypothetical protein